MTNRRPASAAVGKRSKRAEIHEAGRRVPHAPGFRAAAGPCPAQDGMSAIQIAANFNRTACLVELIKGGANVNAADKVRNLLARMKSPRPRNAAPGTHCACSIPCLQHRSLACPILYVLAGGVPGRP